MRNHSFRASPILEKFNGTIPVWRKGNETPSLQADSADRRCFNLLGTLLLNLDFESTLAARTGSVGERQAPMTKAAGREALIMRWANTEVTAHEKVMIGPKNQRTDFQCL
jgi:hypothetical protein